MCDGVDATNPKVLGARIRAEIRQRDMSVGQLAAILGVYPSTVVRYLTGEVTISTPVLGQIAKALGCCPGELLHVPDEAAA